MIKRYQLAVYDSRSNRWKLWAHGAPVDSDYAKKRKLEEPKTVRLLPIKKDS